MFDLSGQQVLLRLIAAVVIVGLHGFFVAGLAVAMGDRGPKLDGRFSINPLKHFEPVGALTMVLFRIGWIRPVAVDVGELRSPVLGVVVIVIGSLLLTLGVAEILWLLRPLVITTFPDASAVQTLSLWIETTVTMSVWFAVINIVPIPPLTGGLILSLMAPSLHRALNDRVLYMAIGLAVIIFSGVAVTVFDPVIEAVRELLLR